MKPTPYKTHLAREFRKNQTRSEKIFWEQVRAKRFQGLKFRRQSVLYGFIVDFLCHSLRLIIEVDGGIHTETREYDIARETLLKRAGYRFFRVTAEEVENDIRKVMGKLGEYIRCLSPASPPTKGQ